jgi:hypothetical protein
VMTVESRKKLVGYQLRGGWTAAKQVQRYYANFTYQAGNWRGSALSSPRSNGIRANLSPHRLYRDQHGAP